jgi:hypothetical protein
MRTTTNEAASTRVRRHAAGVMQRLGPTKATGTGRGVLIHQMSIFGAAALSEVFDLHNLWEHRYIHGRLRSFREIVPLQDFRILQVNAHEQRRMAAGGKDNLPGGRLPCASISARTSVDPSASHRECVLRFPYPP